MVNSIQSSSPVLVRIFDEFNSEFNKNPGRTGQERINEDVSPKPDKINKAATDNNQNKQVSYSGLENSLKELMKDDNIFMEFSVDKDTKKMILKLIDEKTKEVIRQYPPEISLKIARIISSSMNLGNIANATV